MQDKLSKRITGFWISYGTKDSLITMPEKWKATLAKWEDICFIYGFPQRLWHKNRKVKSVPVFNLELLKKLNTVPQGSINGPLFFNLFTNNSELLLTDTFVNNCADDNYS